MATTIWHILYRYTFFLELRAKGLGNERRIVDIVKEVGGKKEREKKIRVRRTSKGVRADWPQTVSFW